MYERLFPQLADARWGHIDFNQIASDLMLLEPMLDQQHNPFLDPHVCESWKNFFHKIMRVDYSYGGYMEDRSVLWAGHYHEEGAVIHLGIDFYVPTGTKVHLPVEGKLVHSFLDPDQNGGWGGKLIFEYRTRQGQTRYMILGHLKDIVSDIGREYHTGEIVGVVAEAEKNGNWSPHLHVQCMRDYAPDVDGYGRNAPDLEERFPCP